MNIFFFDTHC